MKKTALFLIDVVGPPAAIVYVIWFALTSAGCGVKLPPIEIVLERPSNTTPPPVVEPTPTPEPEPPVIVPDPGSQIPEPAPAAVFDLAMEILDAAAAPIVDARVTIGEETRRTDGSGFVHFPVPGSVVVDVSASGFVATRVDLPPGRHRVHLERVPEPPKPTPPPIPPPAKPPTGNLGFPNCGGRWDSGEISSGCLSAVAAASKTYPLCQKGDPVACHRYVREVALALRTTQNDPGWGLITKPRGQQACTMTACGRNVEGGYGEDMVAYLPKGNPTNLWTGLDIIGGAGEPGAHYQGGQLPPATGGRPDNLWAPVPR